MSLRKRVWAAAEQACARVAMVFPICLDNPSDSATRENALSALRVGARLRIIKLSLSLQADNLEAAEALVAAHRESEEDPCGVDVFARGLGQGKPLASWHPEDPAWLQALGDDDLA